MPRPRRFVLGISGASGAAYALRLLEQLLLTDDASAEVHLVVSDYGRRLLLDETGVRQLTIDALVPQLLHSTARPPYAIDQTPAQPDARPKSMAIDQLAPRLFVHPHKDVGAVIASGSFLHDGMAVTPCSSASLGAMASGSGSNLLVRAAMVTLKERRPLIVCHRESPLSLIDVENMRTLTLAGAIVCPTNPGFYLRPRTVDDLVDFVVGKVLDLLLVPHALNTRWERAPTTSRVEAIEPQDD